MTTPSMLPVSRHTTHPRLVIFADLQSLVMKKGKQALYPERVRAQEGVQARA